MESWRKVWRDGLAPQISTEGLTALRKALADDDARLLQGATTEPPPLMCVRDWSVEAACAVTYCGVIDHGGFKGETDPCPVAEAEEYFAKRCFEADQAMNLPASCRWFLNWWDESPRDEVRLAMIPEVDRELTRRREL